MSRVPAHWDAIARGACVVRDSGLPIPVIGNGDCHSAGHASVLAADAGVDGVMIGRASFGCPWLFDPRYNAAVSGVGCDPVASPHVSAGQRLLALLRLIMIWHHAYKLNRGKFEDLRKCFQSYVATAWQSGQRH